MRPVFKCHGGKFYLRKWIISHFPKDYTQRAYIEGCGGGASVLLNKERSVSEAYNDADPGIAEILQELSARDPTNFIKAVQSKEYNGETFELSKTALQCPVDELARRRMSRGGLRESFSWSDRQRGGQPGDVNAWETFKAELIRIAERLHGVEVYCMPVNELVDRFDAENVLWYLDPPYFPSTRRAKEAYTTEMTEREHVKLAESLIKAKGKVLVSGYYSTLYATVYEGWNLSSRSVVNHSGQNGTKQKRIECLWMNY